MRWETSISSIVIGGGMAAAALAQPGSIIAPGTQPLAPPPVITADLKCPANGYAKPWFGGAGDNDGILRGYEIASPCIAKETVAAADAIGMARGNPIGVKSVSTIRFGATGSIAGDSGAPATYADIDVAISYAVPAIRITTRSGAAGGALTGRVFADGAAWDEAAPGIGGKPARGDAIAARAPLMRLTPFGAVLAIVEAEGHATVRQAGGHTVLSGTSPYDNMPVSVTLDEQSRPIAAEVKAGGRTYRATFSDYRDTWESPYLVIFPARLTWTVDGKPLADLTVTRFHSNPYVIFPSPAVLAAAAATAPKEP